ncbi:MAG: response regulator [Pseudomonadota bacterium]
MAQASQPARVVVVDDEPTLAYLFAQYLQRTFQVDWFSSSPQALSFLRLYPADLLVADLIMPELNGLELTGLAKVLQPSLRVVMISGLNPWSWSRGESPHLRLLDSFLIKPVPLRELEQRCQQVLQGRAPLSDGPCSSPRPCLPC